MDDQPAYMIVVVDRGDRVHWELICNNQLVARGNVLLLDDIALDDAFTYAFENANATRLARVPA